MSYEGLSFVIIGGSIAGLSCAYTLQNAGHRVTVLEKSATPYDDRLGSIQCPPNMTRILKTWGLTEWIDKFSVKMNAIVMREGSTGEKMGLVIFHPEIMRQLRADYVTLPYRSLWSVLHDMAIRAGADIRLGETAVQVDPDPPSVLLSSGEELRADYIIGADGYESMIKEVVLDHQLRGAMDRRSLTVPTESMRQDEDLYWIDQVWQWDIWLGDGSCVHGFLSRGKREYTLELILSGSDWEFRQDRNGQVCPQDIDMHLSHFEPRIGKIVRLADKLIPTTYYLYQEDCPNLVHESGNVLLVGEAAHPLPPGAGGNAAACLEDAVTLGELLSHCKSKDRAPIFIAAFEDIRLSRSSYIRKSEHFRWGLITVPSGSKEQKMRDENFRSALPRASRGWEDADEELLRDIWDDYITLFDYEAQEAVEEWWTRWGSLI
ncbi:FAD/NAD P-binding domain-containing protein [Gloeophyllum trabeum ATCC 11539]|uniref:FAD/NAD P-binding domain-containing protein n=1 Tax=Gloeophyllum trabeum (strain ATCC 11539 / FP-39264 / Madison 617) TaxID=670483 RepID=S7RW34_GLOTA|nr:FAD/NAD P-binding domain-containing protein [Gloeophyllum trabeum ATCC 11539]EPQ59065.1 FAD/NAD P-binding domain-containing protein [Gloeophyllum trabeum ATCC 11539]